MRGCYRNAATWGSTPSLCSLPHPPPFPVIPHVLQLLVQNVMHGGDSDPPASKPVIERYLWRAHDEADTLKNPRHRAKPIARLAACKEFSNVFNPHLYIMLRGDTVTVPLPEMRMNHYWGLRLNWNLAKPTEEEIAKAAAEGRMVVAPGKRIDNAQVVYDPSMLVSDSRQNMMRGARSAGLRLKHLLQASVLVHCTLCLCWCSSAAILSITLRQGALKDQPRALRKCLRHCFCFLSIAGVHAVD